MSSATPQSENTSDSIGAREIAALRAIVEGTARASGREFFESLVRHMASVLNVRCAFVTEFTSPIRARSLAFWITDRIIDNLEWDLPGTPCEGVLRGDICHHPVGVSEKYPEDKPLVDMGIQSYLGVPLLDSAGKALGHLAVFDDKPMPSAPRTLLIFRIFAARAAVELEFLRGEKKRLQSEQQYRDLFEEAPIAYVHEGLDSKFISANRAAMRILGLTAEQVPGFIGMSLVAKTPDNQLRLQEAFASIGRGVDTGGVILELKRHDNGKPVWIQWWSRPDPSGSHTRTMFIDITDRVLMEQEQQRLKLQNQYLQEEIKSVHNFEEIVGRSEALQKVLVDVRRVAHTDSSVLILGETGTGKELFARAIHSAGPRRDKPLIKVNCAALPAGLVESELFGHEKGAFSGAIARRIGRFELAHGGTIFLDEIGEVPPEVQVKLLRVLQEREFERIGGNAPIKADVRIIAATNRDLLKAVAEKTFREDLYYRLNVFPIHLPPLRERQGDLPLLVLFLTQKLNAKIGKRIEQITPQTMRRLAEYPWPGNVRELENVIERAVILSRGPTLEVGPEMLAGSPGSPGITVRTSLPGADAARQSMQDIERDHVLSVLQRTHWRIEGDRGAAKILGLHPNTLRSRLKKLGISRPH